MPYQIADRGGYSKSSHCWLCFKRENCSAGIGNHYLCNGCLCELTQYPNLMYNNIIKLEESDENRKYIIKQMREMFLKSMKERHERELDNFDSMFKQMLEDIKLEQQDIEDDKLLEKLQNNPRRRIRGLTK